MRATYVMQYEVDPFTWGKVVTECDEVSVPFFMVYHSTLSDIEVSLHPLTQPVRLEAEV